MWSKAFRTIYFVLPAVLFAGVIFYFSSLSRPPLPELGFEWSDKFLHFLAYMGLGFLTLRACQFGRGQPISRKLFFLSVLMASLYGVSDEIHQYFVPGRYLDFWDWLADFLGSFTGAGFYIWIHQIELEWLRRAVGVIPRDAKIR